VTINPLSPAVVGLDPSLTAFGIAGPYALRTLKTPPASGLVARRERLRSLVRAVTLEVAEAAGVGPALVVIEAPSLGQQRQAGTAERVGLWWLLVDALLEVGHLVVEVAPASRAKYATGKGNAGKTAVASAAAHRYGVVGGFADDNQADAFVLRAMGLHQLGRPLAAVPKAHAAALEVIDWPSAEQLAEAAAVPGPFAGVDTASTFGIRPHRPMIPEEDAQARRIASLPLPGQLALDHA
jgi:Holliday junction resolvasome RuvABC endonuclease subunit